MGSEKGREIHTNLKTTNLNTTNYMKQSLKQWRDVQTPDLDMNSLSPATIDPTGAPRA